MLVNLLMGLALSFFLIGCEGAVGGAQGTTPSDQEGPPSGSQSVVGSSPGDEETATAEVELKPMNGSGATGTITFEQITGGIEIKLDVRGLPRPETVYLAHVHRGACLR